MLINNLFFCWYEVFKKVKSLLYAAVMNKDKLHDCVNYFLKFNVSQNWNVLIWPCPTLFNCFSIIIINLGKHFWWDFLGVFRASKEVIFSLIRFLFLDYWMLRSSKSKFGFKIGEHTFFSRLYTILYAKIFFYQFFTFDDSVYPYYVPRCMRR